MAKIIGIDLGTTNSAVAVMEGDNIKVIENSEGARTTPSIVAYMDNGEVLVGAPAKRQAVTNPKNTLFAVKRLIGRRFDDAEVQKDINLMPFTIMRADNGDAWVEAQGKKLAPQQVSAEILRKMKQTAEDYLGEAVTEAVITVPAYFNDSQRQATKDAGRIAGLEVKRIINEPTAAALAFGMDKGGSSDRKIAVYDLGGGTFDVSLLKLTRGVFEVLATGGNSALGGDDFDHRVLCHVTESFRGGNPKARFTVDGKPADTLPGHILSAAEKRRLMALSRAAKEALTKDESTCIHFAFDNGDEVELDLTREEFDAMTCHLVRKTIDTVEAVLRDASAGVSDVRGVVLVGGATRMPCVRTAVEKFFGFAPLDDIDPDKVVAIGAAMQANKLAGNTSGDDDWLLLDVTPLSLGLETMGGLVEKVIPRNSAIPVALAQDFTTFRDGQTAMAIHVVQGERELVDACRSLARFELRGIPPMAAGAARIRVTFQVDADGLLSVSAREMTTGVEASIQVKPSYGLYDDDIVRMLQDGNGSAEEDMRARELREQQVEARRLLESTHSALASDGDLLDDAERAEVDALVERLTALVISDDVEAVKAGIEALTKGTETLAERRMDRSIREALSGMSVDDEMFDEKPEDESKNH